MTTRPRWKYNKAFDNKVIAFVNTSLVAYRLNFYFAKLGGLEASIILGSLDRDKYLGQLMSYLEPVLLSSDRSRFVRCWHANSDGWAATTFHTNCDGKAPTVTIIEVNDYIFGGYTDVSWYSSEYLNVLHPRIRYLSCIIIEFVIDRVIYKLFRTCLKK